MVYNFSAGPAILPAQVLAQAQAELIDYQGTGMSIMEVSHRSKIFEEVIRSAESGLRELMRIPDRYAVLFTQGGAWTQFSAVPLNLLGGSKRADYLDTGAWSVKAIAEAERYGQVRVVASSKDRKYQYIPSTNPSDFDPDADYVHITTNNTIYGTTFPALPQGGGAPLVADMSSNILSQHYEVEDFGLIYAGAQKNIGPSGLTVTIIQKELLGKAHPLCPKMLNYQTHAEKDSLFNTPPTFAIYLADLVFQWLINQGGVRAMEQLNRQKAGLLYQYLDQSTLFEAPIQASDRSIMNVVFRAQSPEREQAFIDASSQQSFQFLKGHRSVGGMRASLYNAMPLAGVEALIEFMREFERRS
ncbi:MAG: 3-phosphoserine/phosphohydroxythreonine transaminase [Bacteroidota bacterium]